MDEYWNKFAADGKIESYLNYVEHSKKQESVLNVTNSADDRRFNNKRTGNK